MIRWLGTCLIVLSVAFTPARAHETSEDGLGTVHFPISCPAVQAEFERGVALLHSFVYPETVRTFQAIIKQDPDCAMGYWGLAMSERPNPLVPPFPAANVKAAQEAVAQGKAAKTQTPRESQYIAAMETYYGNYDAVDHRTRAMRYEQAMRQLHEQYPDDDEAAIFYALALNEAVDLSDTSFKNQLEAAAILTEQAKKQPNHPGVAHYLIHSYDFAPLAAMCLPTAHLYDKIAPAAPHALHMPSHIYSVLGMWDDSIRSNLAAEAAGREQAARDYPGKDHPSVPHWKDFRSYAYLQMGRDAEARQLAEDMNTINLPPGSYLATAAGRQAIPARYALDRGMWSEAARLPIYPADLPHVLAIGYFTRGIGAARSNDIPAARAEIGHLADMQAKLRADKNDYWAGQVQIQQQAVSAWVMFAEGQRDDAIAAMRKAADLDDASEKNVAMENKLLPIRALLGELYLANGNNKEALEALETSLKTVPNRFRTLLGAAEAARADGQTDTAKRYYRALTGLAANADSARPELAEARTYLAGN